MRALALALGALALSLGCGGSQPAPEAPRRSAAPQEDEGRGLASERFKDDEAATGTKVTAQVGGLPPEGVANTFNQASEKLARCFKKGLKRVEFMGGAVKFFVKVDTNGKFMHAHLERSDLGDRKTEQCLLDVLIKYKWPTPVGGTVGVATFSMSFEPSPDAAVPADWSIDKVSDVIAAHEEQIDDCKSGIPGDFNATVYVRRGDPGDDDEEPKGVALAASVTPPDEAGEMVVDCLVTMLMKAAYPDPGAGPAKAAFKL